MTRSSTGLVLFRHLARVERHEANDPLVVGEQDEQLDLLLAPWLVLCELDHGAPVQLPAPGIEKGKGRIVPGKHVEDVVNPLVRISCIAGDTAGWVLVAVGFEGRDVARVGLDPEHVSEGRWAGLEGNERRAVDDLIGFLDPVLTGPSEQVDVEALAGPQRRGQESAASRFAPEIAPQQVELLR